MSLTQRVASLAVFAAISTSAFAADQTFTGTVTVLDRTTSEVVIKQTPPSGETVGANTTGAPTTGATETFKLLTVPESLHAGEKVTVTYTEAGGIKTISNVKEQKD